MLIELDKTVKTLSNFKWDLVVRGLSEDFSLLDHLLGASCEQICHLVDNNFSLTLLMVNWFKVAFFYVAFVRRHAVRDKSLDFTLFKFFIFSVCIVEVEIVFLE